MVPSKNGSKSQAIRDHLTASPTANASETIAALKQWGISVTPALFYLVKGKMKLQKRRQKRERVESASREMGIVNPVDLIMKVKKVAVEAGGIKRLKQLVDLMAESNA